MKIKFLLLVYPFVVLLFIPMLSLAQDDSTDQRPNILFAISDDVSFPHKSAYGLKPIPVQHLNKN